ncbi:MAG: hypothetical protein ABUT20_48245, partial [Bacteroidota bacterium]
IFNEKGILTIIDCTDTNMNDQVMKHFKSAAPVTVDQIETAFTAPTVVVAADFEVSFEMFWKKYNKKINKSRCMLLWSKMDKTLQVLAYMGIAGYDKYLKKESWRTKADPETYLRNKYWENEYK